MTDEIRLAVLKARVEVWEEIIEIFDEGEEDEQRKIAALQTIASLKDEIISVQDEIISVLEGTNET